MRLFPFLVVSILIATGCGGPRLSSRVARDKVAEIASSTFVPDAIEIRRIVSQTEDMAIAETTVTLAFQFRKNAQSGEWVVESVRLGDREWVDLNEILSAIEEGRRNETTDALQKLATGIEAFQTANNSIPQAADIVGLTDILHPQYMPDLIRADAWGRPIEYEASGTTFRLISRGPDSVLGTPDDIVVTSGTNPDPVL